MFSNADTKASTTDSSSVDHNDNSQLPELQTAAAYTSQNTNSEAENIPISPIATLDDNILNEDNEYLNAFDRSFSTENENDSNINMKKSILVNLLSDKTTTSSGVFENLKRYNFSKNFITYIQNLITYPENSKKIDQNEKKIYIRTLIQYIYSSGEIQDIKSLEEVIKKSTRFMHSLSKQELLAEFKQLTTPQSSLKSETPKTPVLNYDSSHDEHQPISPKNQTCENILNISCIDEFLKKTPTAQDEDEDEDEQVLREILIEYIQYRKNNGELSKARSKLILEYIKVDKKSQHGYMEKLQSQGISEISIQALTLCKSSTRNYRGFSLKTYIQTFLSKKLISNDFEGKKQALVTLIALVFSEPNQKRDELIANEFLTIEFELPSLTPSQINKKEFTADDTHQLDENSINILAAVYPMRNALSLFSNPNTLNNEQIIASRLIAKCINFRKKIYIENRRPQTELNNYAFRLKADLVKPKEIIFDTPLLTISHYLCIIKADDEQLEKHNFSFLLINLLKRMKKLAIHTLNSKITNVLVEKTIINKGEIISIIDKYNLYEDLILRKKINKFIWTELNALRYNLPSPIPENPKSWYFSLPDTKSSPPIINSIENNNPHPNNQKMPSYVRNCKLLSKFFEIPVADNQSISKDDQAKAEVLDRIFTYRCGLK